MSIQINEINHKIFGRCVKITNEYAEALASLDYGPRILSFRLHGRENVLFEDMELKIKEDSEVIKEYYGRDAVWYSRGGHRLWIAPESIPKTYYPDNTKVHMRLNGDQIILEALPQVENNVTITIEIEMVKSKPKLKINHIVKNIGKEKINIAPWAITVMNPGGLEIIPRPEYKAGLTPNTSIAVWPYTDLGDERIAWGSDCITVMQKSLDSKALPVKPFKIGINNSSGWALYLYKDLMFKKEFPFTEKVEYPDMGVSFETYTNNYFLEMESLGPIREVLEGESVSHEEKWTLSDIPDELIEMWRIRENVI